MCSAESDITKVSNGPVSQVRPRLMETDRHQPWRHSSYDFLFFKVATVAVSALVMRWRRTHAGPVTMSAILSPVLATVHRAGNHPPPPME